LLVTGACLANDHRPATIRVPEDQPTIQAGIDAASLGDTVLVAPDTYTGAGNTDLDFGGIDRVLRSREGAESTVIDCAGAARGVHFRNHETPASVVEGFTIRKGWTNADGDQRLQLRDRRDPEVGSVTLASLALAAVLGGTPVSPAGGELVPVAFWPRPNIGALEPWGATRALVAARDMIGVVRVETGDRLVLDWLAPGPYNKFGGTVSDLGPIYAAGRKDNFAILDTTGVLLGLVAMDEPGWRLKAEGSALFVGPAGGSHVGLRSYDISDPLDPVLVSSVLVGTSDLVVTSDHVFTGGLDRHDLAALARSAGDSLVLLDHEEWTCSTRYLAYSAPWLLSSLDEDRFGGDCQQLAKFEGDSLRIVHTDLDVRYSGDLEVVESRIYAVGWMEGDSTYGIATLEPREPADLVLTDFLPLDRLSNISRLAWLESGYLLASGGPEGLTLLAADPDGTLHPRDWIGLRGVPLRFDLDGDLLVSSEGSELRWVRNPFDPPTREIGHAAAEDHHWGGIAIVPDTDFVISQRSRGTVESFELEDQPIPISSDSLRGNGGVSSIHAAPGLVLVVNQVQFNLFSLDQQGHLGHLDYVGLVDVEDAALEMWNDSLAIATQGIWMQGLWTFAPGDTATVQRAYWTPNCGTPLDMDIRGREVAYATGCAIEFWDLTDPDSPRFTEEWRPPPGQAAESVALAPGFAVVATWGDSLYVLDRTGPEIRQVASALLPARSDNVELGLDTEGRPHVVCQVGGNGYIVFTLREGRLERAPAPPLELWGFEERR